MPDGPSLSQLDEADIDQLWVAWRLTPRSSTQVHQVIDRERAFSAYVSHQLRTPLAAARVVAEAELAAPRDPPVTVLHEFLSSLDRLDDTTEQLLAVSRGVADRRRGVSLVDLARRAHSRWVVPFRRAGRPLDVTVRTRVTATLAEAAFDQILDVVLDNALQHGTGRTRLTISGNGTCQVIAIGDQGHIAPGTEPFSTPARRGHGIGLTLAAALAEAEGWTLTVGRRDPTTFELHRVMIDTRWVEGRHAGDAPPRPALRILHAMERATIFVRGQVQGVGFRWWTRARALELGLVGHARNMPDGRVEVVAQGDAEAIGELVTLLEERPSRTGRPGEVAAVVTQWSGARPGVTQFVAT